MAIIKIKRGTKAAVEAAYAAKKLEYGELAVAIDTNKLYFTKADQSFAILNPDGGTSDSASKLTVARAIALSGAVTGTVDFDGTKDVTIETVLENVGTAGTYYKVTTDAKGRVTSGVTTLTVEDLPNIPVAKITGLGDLATKNQVDLVSELDQKYDAIGTAESKANAALDSAKNYADTKIEAQISTVYRPAGSLAPAGLVTDLLIAGNIGKVYNITGEFITDANFVEGTGHSYPAGTNVVVINNGTDEAVDYKFDVLAGFIDLSAYAKTTDVETKIGEAKTEILGQVDIKLEPYAKTADVNTKLEPYAKSADVTTEINGAVDAAKTEISNTYATKASVTAVEQNVTNVTNKVTAITTALGGETGTIPDNIVSEVKAGDGISVDANGKTPTVSVKVDGATIKVGTDKAMYVDVIDGGVLTTV